MIFILILCFLLGAGLLFYMFKEAFADRVVYQELQFVDFPESFGEVNLFFISDIHRRRISDQIIEKVKGNVDIVIIGGDMTEKGVPLERVKDNILQLKKLGPVIFVRGNNDYEIEIPLLDSLFLSLDVKVLVNRSIFFESKQGERFYILGVDDLSTNRADIDQALIETDDNSFKILVSHNPEMNRKIREDQGISLMLSGHTHGGQIHILGFSLYEKGRLKREHNRTILISNGYGTTGVPLRLGAKAETHLLTICQGHNQSF
ncbi:metallophosphoesterase [Niallia endozanthoxylica]|uniref:Metallophosphoesterase n=2 Tax=Niallia endozanthoxylica TaxID=2036016 RepID=A0A5J5HVP8_9BACI|nr:metallophosphoesterase [Niallia endozanthoxylica]